MADAKWVVDEQTGQRWGAYCGTCKMLWAASTFGGGESAATEAHNLAEACCKPRHCEVCGTETNRHWTLCSACLRKKEQAREGERVEGATPMTYEQFCAEIPDAMLCVSEIDDGFYEDLEGLAEHLAYSDGTAQVPEYVWPTKPETLRLDADDILEQMTHDYPEGARDNALVHCDELQQLLDGWCAAHPIVTYYPDYSRVIRLTDEQRDELRAALEQEG